MRYGEAFQALGYTLKNRRQDWTAAHADGVCLTLWQSEIDWQSEPARLDSRVHCKPLAFWQHKRGNALRRQHIGTALEHHAAWVDAIIVTGTPGKGVTDARPWLPAVEGRRWRVTHFEPETGHFAVEALPV